MFFGLRLVAFYVAHPITRYYCSKDHKKWSRKGSFPVCDSNDIVIQIEDEMHHLSLASPKIFYSDLSTSVPEKGEGKK